MAILPEQLATLFGLMKLITKSCLCVLENIHPRGAAVSEDVATSKSAFASKAVAVVGVDFA